MQSLTAFASFESSRRSRGRAATRFLDGATTLLTSHPIQSERLLQRLRELGETGRGADGVLSRLALSDADRAGRELVAAWMRELGLRLEVDAIGNLFGTWPNDSTHAREPVMIGSHLDTVINAGIYDGSYGVVAGLEVLAALRAHGTALARPVTVAAFTNEEGVRYTPDMMGSLVHAGGLPLEQALASRGTDGTILGEELRRIGYAGPLAPGTIRPHAFIELHVEQGPVLEEARCAIGAVDSLQGISWSRLTITGQANHAGTTPMRLRRDAGQAAARVTTFLHDLAERSGGMTVATVGTMALEPGAINVIPARATMTVDLRDPDNARLAAAEAALDERLRGLESETGVAICRAPLARFEPVQFDKGIVAAIEDVATGMGLPVRRMTSGAGHDAQMMARVAPSAMIFVPSRGGISHSPDEETADDDLIAGANVLLGVVRRSCGV